MKRYILNRLWQLLIVLIGVSFLTFLLMYISPSDAAQKKLRSQGIAVSREVIEKEQESLGLNRPFAVQYADWLLGVLRGDLGLSYKDGIPVAAKLTRAMRYTLLLSSASLAVSLFVSAPLAVISAVRKDGFLDSMIGLFSFLGNSLPNFLISVMLMYFFCIKIQLLPVIADESLKGLLLPCLALSIPMCARFIRQFRALILEELSKEYVLAARVRGTRERYVIWGGAVHNSLPSIMTIVALATGTLFGGSVVIESIFRWPGLGKLVMDSITARDYPVIQGFVLFSSLIYVMINLFTDILYRLIDPRVREG